MQAVWRLAGVGQRGVTTVQCMVNVRGEGESWACMESGAGCCACKREKKKGHARWRKQPCRGDGHRALLLTHLALLMGLDVAIGSGDLATIVGYWPAKWASIWA